MYKLVPYLEFPLEIEGHWAEMLLKKYELLKQRNETDNLDGFNDALYLLGYKVVGVEES